MSCKNVVVLHAEDSEMEVSCVRNPDAIIASEEAIGVSPLRSRTRIETGDDFGAEKIFGGGFADVLEELVYVHNGG
jgi:hypothetical protein